MIFCFLMHLAHITLSILDKFRYCRTHKVDSRRDSFTMFHHVCASFSSCNERTHDRLKARERKGGKEKALLLALTYVYSN